MSNEMAALEARLPKRRSDVRVKRCYSELDPLLARRVIAVWDGMLTDLRAADRIGVDGESFQFASIDAGRELEGQTWSPEEGSRGAMLVEIAYSMKRMCNWGTSFSYFLRVRLAREVEALEKRLGEKGR